MQQSAVTLRDQCNFAGHVGHVESAGDAKQHGGAEEEHGRRQQVDGHVMQGGTHSGPAGTMQQQAIGGREHDFKKHEQVEEVGGQEGAVDPHELQLEQGVKVHASTVPAGM